MEEKVKVLVVDDSATIRRLLTQILSSDPQIEVVGSAPDPYVARDKIKALDPDVLTLDVEMPRMDGLAFLRNLMRLRPMPVVMCSTLTQAGATTTLEALELGAVDFIAKPSVENLGELRAATEEITAKVKAAALAHVRTAPERTASERRPAPEQTALVVPEKYDASIILPRRALSAQRRSMQRLIAIGASTGGTEAIKEVLMDMPPDSPAVVITQHIPQAFSGPFARRMNAHCDLTVHEAQDGQPIEPGHVYIAPGDQHLLVVPDGAGFRCELNDGPPVNRHRPSVDVLFRSVAQNVGASAIGVMLTGMGRDGAAGMQEMREAGALNFVQDEATSVVWGMPRAAWELGAAHEMLPLEAIAARVIEAARTPRVGSRIPSEAAG